jgi:TonB family protein
VQEAIRAATRGSAGGGLTVGDVPGDPGLGGIGEGMNLPPSPGRQASNLELLSDPMGVDFRPYLIRVLSTVRRNWFAVMPESAKWGRQGRVNIQFSIARNGSVPKLVITGHSGTDALDRAAVAGISASNPFPPLPAEFRGERILLQLNFAYNIVRR